MRFSLGCKLAGFIIGTLAVLLPLLPAYAALLVFGLSVIADLVAWRSDTYKAIAETLRRKLDGQDAFGWEISKAEISDLLVRSPSNLDKLVVAEVLAEKYFASREGYGTRRALENIQESAWWSKHLSERMRNYYLTGTCLLVGVSLVVLLTSVQTVNNQQFSSSLGRIVTSVLTLVFSLNLFRSVLGYQNFSLKAGQVEKAAESLLMNTGASESDAIKLMNEYHLARAFAPLLPAWLWKAMRSELNETWKKYRQY
ncbi:hypothetical protein H6F86_23615 [Phormidium sp. FACHB-592]|uniref:Uncharacterized protein n=1 Tax=Stenomitos frigidus AS-A4 TaxID=2933935 RepID=A0ABV0KTM7_9CYAN|nr:hypothetical protein [Phormidium sp. FACHB-592]MBD2076821.1 hypothetical protein [Phormidium sp. FACHB-592]